MMKYLYSLLMACSLSAYGQDTTKIVYGVESDTLIKQRFIDKYENVFMTKVPTRHMFKLGVGQSNRFYDPYSEDFFTMSHEMGYEYKVLSDFSVGVNAALNGGFGYSSSSGVTFNGTVYGELYGRWYYDMKRRIREGKGANNFSGNFVASTFEKQLTYKPYKVPTTKIGLEFGMQRRFLNHGRLELAVGAYYQKTKGVAYNDRYYYTPFDLNGSTDLVISTRSSLSMAFGDWKPTHQGSACEILRCEQGLTQQWKIMWPNLSIGTKSAQGAFGAGYERKLRQSPFSVNTQIMTNFYNGFKGGISAGQSVFKNRFETNSSIQLRYYYLQKRKIRTGRGGNNLSGIYAGLLVEYITEKWGTDGKFPGNSNQDLGFGLTYGYQKTLLNNFYIDVNGSGSWAIFESKQFLPSLKIGFGLRF